MDNKQFWSVMATCIAFSAIILLGLSLMSASADETKEYFDDGCLVKVHKDNRLRGEDTVSIKRYCGED